MKKTKESLDLGLVADGETVFEVVAGVDGMVVPLGW